MFEKFHSLLAAKYGNSKNFDFVNSDTVWNKSNEWSWSLYKNDRHLTSFWDRGEGSNMPDRTESIQLSANSVHPGTNYISLSYEFSNFGACKQTSDNSDGKGL